MGLENVAVFGYESQLLHSVFSYGQHFQFDHHNQDNHSLGDFNSSLNLHLHQPLCQVTDDNVKKFPNLDDKKYWILAAFALILIRQFVERCIFQPLWRRIGLKDQSRATLDSIPCRSPNAVPHLQKSYSSNKKLTNEQLQALSNEIGLEQREIERWMRRRRAFDKTSTLVKFSESGWRLVAYASTTFLGIVSVWDKWWFWDFQNLWQDYPNHELSDSTRWYYCLSEALYISFVLTQFFDVKRKDFWEMFLHHILAIGLLTLSFATNMTRAGIIAFVLHDFADIFLESAKLAMYAKKKNLSTGILVLFTIVWFVTRLWIYPVKIIYQSIWQQGTKVVPSHIIYSAIGMCVVLLVLHLFWTYFICKLTWSAVKSEANNKDSRSSSESSGSSSDSSASSDDRKKVRRDSNITSPSISFMTKQRAIMRRISVDIMERNE